MTGEDLIELAGWLVASNGGNPPAKYRTAVGRAYYGAFNAVKDFFETEFQISVAGNHTGHREAYLKLFQSKIPEAIEAARLLDSLRSDRNEADYDMHKPRLENVNSVRVAIETAHDVVSALASCCVEPTREKLRSKLSENP